MFLGCFWDVLGMFVGIFVRDMILNLFGMFF